MDNELRAILKLKQIFRMDPRDNSITRAPEYEILKGGRTMFFRDGKGKVYETMPDWNNVNSYDEEYLRQAIELVKYSGKTMLREDVEEFLNSPVLEALFCSQEDTDSTIRIICATLEALGYDAEWIREMLVPQMVS